MKIETTVKTHVDHSVRYSKGIEVKYDSEGIADVSDEVGQYLIEKYVDQIFPEGKVVVPMVRTTPSTVAKGNETNEVLGEKLQRANQLLNSCKAELSQTKEGEKLWRIKCEELLKENESLKKQLGNKTLNNITSTTIPPDEDTAEAIRKKLNARVKDELLKIATELELPKEEYQDLSKAKLVDYLVQKTIKNVNT